MKVDDIWGYLNPKLKGTRWRPVTIVGPPESGKTTMAQFISSLIIGEHGEDKVNLIYAKKLKNAIKYLDEKPFQLILIDDAVRYQYSRYTLTREGRMIIADYYEIRHVYNKYRKKHRNAALFIFFITQRWRDLSPQFREAPLIFFKGTLVSFENNRDIERVVGTQYFNILRELTRRIYALSDDTAKSEAVAHTAWMERYHVQGIKLVNLDLRLVDEDERPEDLAEDLADEILQHFGHKTLILPTPVIKGFLRQYAMKHGLDFIPLDAIDIAKFRAYERWGLPEQIPDEEIKRLAENIVNNLMKMNEIKKWLNYSHEERLGYILYAAPHLKEREARKILRIINYLLTKMGIDTKTKWLTAGEAAKILGISSRTITRYIQKGMFQNVMKVPGGHYRIALSDVLRILETIKINKTNETG
ncbi:MAG: helix-turn-helix domain-containing protein [Candidatus Njordarchaeum guaymaensis]